MVDCDRLGKGVIVPPNTPFVAYLDLWSVCPGENRDTPQTHTKVEREGQRTGRALAGVTESAQVII